MYVIATLREFFLTVVTTYTVLVKSATYNTYTELYTTPSTTLHKCIKGLSSVLVPITTLTWTHNSKPCTQAQITQCAHSKWRKIDPYADIICHTLHITTPLLYSQIL